MSSIELELVYVLDFSGLLLSCMTWLSRLCENEQALTAAERERCGRLLQRLETFS